MRPTDASTRLSTRHAWRRVPQVPWIGLFGEVEGWGTAPCGHGSVGAPWLRIDEEFGGKCS